jgi:hypothetical protein
MISKRDLLEAIDQNTAQIVWQGQTISELLGRVEALESNTRGIRVAKHPGRPKKICVKTGASKQPRTKDGRFAKK